MLGDDGSAAPEWLSSPGSPDRARGDPSEASSLLPRLAIQHVIRLTTRRAQRQRTKVCPFTQQQFRAAPSSTPPSSSGTWKLKLAGFFFRTGRSVVSISAPLSIVLSVAISISLDSTTLFTCGVAVSAAARAKLSLQTRAAAGFSARVSTLNAWEAENSARIR